MATFYKFKLKQDTHFGQQKVEAGTVLAVLRAYVAAADPIQLLSMVNYRQVEVEVVEAVEPKDPTDDVASDETETSEGDDIENDVDVDAEQPEGGDLDLDGSEDTDIENDSEQPDTVSVDLASLGLEEAIVKALHVNKINNVLELFAYVDSGKDLFDLVDIGASRKSKILTAMGRN